MNLTKKDQIFFGPDLSQESWCFTAILRGFAVTTAALLTLIHQIS